MNVQTLNQRVERSNPSDLFSGDEVFVNYGYADNQIEARKGLRRIIRLSMHCLEIMLRNGHTQGEFDRDNLAQVSDPYVEGLLIIMRKGNTDR